MSNLFADWKPKNTESGCCFMTALAGGNSWGISETSRRPPGRRGLKRREGMTTNVVEFPDPEICRELCRRCGVSIQATHHELCEARDGTPTDLDDSTVRRLIRQKHPELDKS